MKVFKAELNVPAIEASQLKKSAHQRKFCNHLTANPPGDRPSAPQGNQCLISLTARTENLALVKSEKQLAV